MSKYTQLFLLLGAAALLLAACTGAVGGETAVTAPPTAGAEPDTRPPAVEPTATRIPAETYADLEIVTLLPRDAIPAIDDPRFLSTAEADAFYDPDELVMGVEFNGEARAYSVPFLSSHEIVNDTVGGVKIAVTW